MNLPDAERAELAAILTDSVADGFLDPDIEAAWVAEAKRRLEDIRTGKSKTIPWEEVERELEEIIEGRSTSGRVAR